MSFADFDMLIEKYHQSLAYFAKGDAEYVLELLSKGNEVSLPGGFGGFAQGYDQVSKAIRFAATQFREGQIMFDGLAKVVTQGMGYIVEVERYKSKLGGSDEISLDVLRVTSILRKEGAEWKLIHRHGDPTSAMNALVQLIPKAVVSITKAV